MITKPFLNLKVSLLTEVNNAFLILFIKNHEIVYLKYSYKADHIQWFIFNF